MTESSVHEVRYASAILTEALVAGHEWALRALYQRYAPLVHTLAIRSCGNRESAELITRDVFVRAWRERPHYRADQRSLPIWLFGLTRELLITAGYESGDDDVTGTDDAVG